MFNKDLEELRSNTISEMKNKLGGTDSRVTEAEQVSDLEDRMMELVATEQNKEKTMKRNENSLRKFWDNITCTNIHIRDQEREKEEKGAENVFEDIIAEIFPDL